MRNHQSQRLMIKCLTVPDQIGIWKCWFFRRGENRSTRRKTSRSRVENQQQTQSTYDAGSRNRTRDTLVGREASALTTTPSLLPQKARYGNFKTSESRFSPRHLLLSISANPVKVFKCFTHLNWSLCSSPLSGTLNFSLRLRRSSEGRTQ